jgi:hypothetical protein
MSPDASLIPVEVRMMEPTWPLPEEEEERHRIHWKFVDKCKGDWDLYTAAFLPQEPQHGSPQQY